MTRSPSSTIHISTGGQTVQIAIRDRSSRGSGTFAGKEIKKNDNLPTEYNTFSVPLGSHPLVVTDRAITLDLVTQNSDGSIQKWIVSNPFPVNIAVAGVTVGEKYSQSFPVGTTMITLARK